MRGEVVQRLFGPALRRELADQPPDDAQILGVVAELAARDRVEKERLALARRLLDVRPDAVARVARPLQEVVALGEPQLRPARGRRPAPPGAGRRRRRAPARTASRRTAARRVRAPACSGSCRARSAAIGSVSSSELGDRREVAERELVDARARTPRSPSRCCRSLAPLAPAASAHRRAPSSSSSRGARKSRARPPDRRALRRPRLRAARRLDEEADRVLRRQRLEGPARVRRPPEPQLREPLVVLRVVAERALLDAGCDRIGSAFAKLPSTSSFTAAASSFIAGVGGRVRSRARARTATGPPAAADGSSA